MLIPSRYQKYRKIKRNKSMSFFKKFDKAITEAVNRQIRGLYPRTWAECRKCGRALKDEDMRDEHEKMCNEAR